MGRMADRHGRKKIFYIGAIFSILPMLWITHLGAMSVPLILLSSSFFFMGMSGRMVPAMAISSSAATPRYRASFMSFSACIQQLAAASASYVAGLIVVKEADGKLLHYEMVGYIAVLFTMLALLMVRKVQSAE